VVIFIARILTVLGLRGPSQPLNNLLYQVLLSELPDRFIGSGSRAGTVCFFLFFITPNVDSLVPAPSTCGIWLF